MNRLLSVLPALACLAAGPAVAAEVKAVASFSILADMVGRVGGDRVEVTSIVGRNADTHVYEPHPKDVAELGSSQVFFINGLGFEGWLARLVQATGYQGPVVTASEGVVPHTMDDGGRSVIDPHAWQNLANGLIYVTNIRDGLCRVDATGCSTYIANAATYSAELEKLDAEIKSDLAAVPEAQRKVITTHDAFGYFGAAYGIRFMAPVGVSTESEASAADVAGLIRQIRDEGVKALFIENMSDPRLTEQIARETGAKIGGELYPDALSELDEPAPAYLEMVRHNAALITAALQGQ